MRTPMVLALACLLAASGLASSGPNNMPKLPGYTLDPATAADPQLQKEMEEADTKLRNQHGMTEDQTAAGLLDMRTLRLAMVRPDRTEYGASIPKILILLAYFVQHPSAATNLDARTRHELGLMIKASDNAIAATYSQAIGLKRIQEAADSHGLYDLRNGGGLWLGKHYGKDDERYADPVAGHSHAANIRQLLRYYLLLEQGRLVSPAASRTMRTIFDSPQIPHRNDKFVKGLAGRGVLVLRKSGWWENWSHDSAIITGPNRHYILAAMTRDKNGDAYLEQLAAKIDDVLRK